MFALVEQGTCQCRLVFILGCLTSGVMKEMAETAATSYSQTLVAKWSHN